MEVTVGCPRDENGAKGKPYEQAGAQRKPKVPPSSTTSFCEFIRGVTARINKLDAYLAGTGANDKQTRATRDALVAERNASLRNLPERVKLEPVVKLCRELGLYAEMGLPVPSSSGKAAPSPKTALPPPSSAAAAQPKAS